MLGAKISFVAVGAWVGLVVGFFGGGLLLIGLVALLRSTGTVTRFSPFMREFQDFAFWILNPVIGAFIGAFVGYLIYKRSKYSKIAYHDPFA